MTFNELLDEVYALTKRPDLSGLTSNAVRSATLKLHQRDFFTRDIFESGLNFATASYLQDFNFKTLLPRWRRPKYFRITDVTGAPYGNFLEYISPDNVLNYFQEDKTNVYYEAGDSIKIRCSSPYQYFLFGCYLNPDVTPAGFTSWIAVDHPWAIIYEAAAKIGRSIGKTQEEASWKLDALESWQTVLISNLTSPQI